MGTEEAQIASAASSRPPLPPKGFDSPTPKLEDKIRADLIQSHSRDSTPEPAFRTYFNGDVPMSPSTVPNVMPMHPFSIHRWCGSLDSSRHGDHLLLLLLHDYCPVTLTPLVHVGKESVRASEWRRTFPGNALSHLFIPFVSARMLGH